MNVFRKKKPEALAFVDFEYFEISFMKRYGIRPPVLEWYRELCETYTVAELYVFADFSNPAMKCCLPELRKITNHIIETQNTASYHKKDFTDFFILDQIYQKAFEKHRAGTYVLFTGDGHFGAVCRFLTEKCGKEVLVYGIEGNISGGLRAQAAKVIEYPSYEKLKTLYYPVIASKMKEMTEGKQKQAILNAPAVIRAVSEQRNLNQSAVHDALQDMMEKGYVIYREEWVSTIKRMRVLSCDWDRIKADGLLQQQEDR